MTGHPSHGVPGHSVGPRRTTWTHIALAVKDVDASIAWYEAFTHLRLLAQGEDADGRNAWLGDPANPDNPFILVLGQFYEGHDPFAPTRAKAAGCLGLGPVQMPKQIGYVCFIKDPDGNTVEYSFDQGVYEKARQVWGKQAEPA